MSAMGRILVYARAATELPVPLLRLALEHAAELTVCDIVEAPPPSLRNAAPATRLHERLWIQSFERLHSLSAPAARTIRVDVTVLRGPAPLAVTEHARASGADLLVHLPAASPASPDEAMVCLLEESPCPVWTFGPPVSARLGGIVIAVGEPAGVSAQLAEGARPEPLAAALALAAANGARIHLGHGWQPYGGAQLGAFAGEPSPAGITGLHDAQRDEHAHWLERLASRVRALVPDHLEVLTHLRQGTLAQVAAAVARDTGAQALALAGPGASATGGLLAAAALARDQAAAGVGVLSMRGAGAAAARPLERLSLAARGGCHGQQA